MEQQNQSHSSRPRSQEYRDYILGVLEEKQHPATEKKTLRVHVRSIRTERRE